MQVDVPATTRPQIRRKLACERNSAAGNVGNIANAPVESTALQGRRRLALAVVVGFGGGEEVDHVKGARFWRRGSPPMGGRAAGLRSVSTASPLGRGRRMTCFPETTSGSGMATQMDTHTRYPKKLLIFGYGYSF